ncbi:MAG: SAM-dependent methyltransferase [Candidatus Bathyarchaeia archaeon]
MVGNCAKNTLKFVIEHLEPEIGTWLNIEYMHASEIVSKNRLIFTNVKGEADKNRLSSLGTVKEQSFAELYNPLEIVILDPKANSTLTPEDLANKKAVVIGGILGDHPPRGRTKLLMTSRCSEAAARNIGKDQFAIDGTVYVAKLVSEGFRLEEIPVKKGLTIKLSGHHSIYLPYAYPLKDDKPLIHKALIEYLRAHPAN